LKKIRFLRVQFDSQIAAFEIPAFRGAIASKAGLEHILFHNHLNDKELLYGYPVIQYKRIGVNPAIVCIDYGVDEIHHLFSTRNLTVHIGERPVPLDVKNLQMHQYTLQVWEKSFTYRMYNWLALSQENYQRYQTIQDDLERISFLEGILTGNILAFAKGVKWDVDRTIRLRIDEVLHTKLVPYKSQRLMAFDLTFRTNVFLPDFIGLGKGVSLGFGTVSQLKERNK
jgi:hypothetical protein